MLTTNQLRQIAFRTGARDLANVEIEVLLTYILQLFHERGLHEHLAFKGGTMLRKMVFGSRGRLSTDLDFTRRSDISVDDLTTLMLDALAEPYHGISFRFDRDGDWYLTDDSCAANPFCSHEENQPGIKVKLQVSTRERPILPVVLAQQIEEDYFRMLPFEVASVPSLVLEEAIAEKIRAASQRSKIRDLHDLAEISRRPINHDLIRTLAVLKALECRWTRTQLRAIPGAHPGSSQLRHCGSGASIASRSKPGSGSNDQAGSRGLPVLGRTDGAGASSGSRSVPTLPR